MNKIYYLCNPFTDIVNVTDKYSIAYKGLDEGRHQYTFEVDDTLFDLFGNQEVRNVKATAQMEMSKGSHMLTIDVQIQGEVTVDCDRCLEELVMPVDFDGQLLVRFSDEIQEYDGEIMWIGGGESNVNLAQYIYESICLSLPYQRMHEDVSLCNPEMVSGFKIVTQEEFDDITAPKEELENSPEWDKLKALKEALEREK